MKTTPRTRGRREAGMTLVELLVTAAILGTVMLVASTIMMGSSRMESRTSERATVQGGARQALSLISTELRQAGADPSSPPVGIVGIVSADSLRIRVRADLNGNGTIQTAEPSEDVTYAYNDTTGTITRDPGTGPVVLLANVTAMTLQYFDSANQPITGFPLSTTDAARVHSIGLSFTSEVRQSQPLTLSTRVTLRNM
ncbi:MAG: prepilin-type N-terminal cleavage/methylation domain-containing protein [Candidatus Eisenbacteria bacterium]|nr:prepilin-type N-terminal cleavage/methylation domain-containing protein [Candidatus Eisenbacteria bacterium]